MYWRAIWLDWWVLPRIDNAKGGANLLCVVALVQRYMQLHNEVELSALGMGNSSPPQSFSFYLLNIFSR